MTIIDLSLLPAPDVIEPLDFESVYQDMLSCYRALMGAEWSAALESDPVVKLLELAAYREVQIRARINDAARSVMLAYASGGDLDQIGANYGVPRLADEDDARYRYRIQQGFNRLAAAGPINAYRQHVLAVSTDIVDVDVWSESPGRVTLSVLARELHAKGEMTDVERAIGESVFGLAPQDGEGYALAETDSQTLRRVLSAMNADDVRPLTDSVIVRAPTVRSFSISAVVEVMPGPDAELIRSRREQALRDYIRSMGRIGYDVTRAGIIAALVEPGVKNVRLAEPLADIVCVRGELAVMLAVRVVAEVANA